jgi:VanZ family protein
VAILYGSFYPFEFYLHHDPRGAWGILLASGFRPSSRDDLVSNVLLYIPFGFFVGYAFERNVVAAATAAGFGLSLFVELVQFYDSGRFQAMSDIEANTAGALLGGLAALATKGRISSVSTALLLGCWFGSRWYPAAPPGASIFALDLLRYFVCWIAAGAMMAELTDLRLSRIGLPVLLGATLLLRAAVLYIEPAEIAGGLAATLVWGFWLSRMKSAPKIIAPMMTGLLILLALAPFRLVETPGHFGWMPFRAFLNSPTGPAIRVFFEKAFLYGGFVWLWTRAGASIAAAAACGASLELALRLFQIYLPGRSAEITDAVLLLMLAAMMQLSTESDRQQTIEEGAVTAQSDS